MNLLLVDASELHDVRELRISGDDRRAQHLRTVLEVAPGTRLRAGVIGGALGTATVIADDGDAIHLVLELGDTVPSPFPVELVLAVPRPKVLTRAIEAAASFGVTRIDLTNAWRVDKSYLDSPRLDPDALALAARLGAEQGGTTHVPPIELHRRLMALLDDRWPAGESRSGTCLIAHPGGAPIENAIIVAPSSAPDRPVVLAIGPEGGWIPREVETFVARGFTEVSLGDPILRVETALAAALGQLAVLDRLRTAVTER